MIGAKLVGSMANNADFSDANMSLAKIHGADLRGARLVGADLSGANFEGVKLTGAVMNNAILTGVNMEQLTNAGADLSNTLTDDNVGLSIVELQKPLMHMIDDHQLWVNSSGQQ